MHDPISSLFFIVLNLYSILLFVRLFTTDSERYDAVLGMVFRATDPVVLPVETTLRSRGTALAPLLVILVLLLLKGMLMGSLYLAFAAFVNTLYQLYVLIIIIMAAFREYYTNPIASFGQRIVRPVRLMAASVSQHRATVNGLSILGLVVLHVIVTLLLRGLFGPEILIAEPVKSACIGSLRLILNLTQFFTLVIIANALLSWVNPDPSNPIVQLLTLIAHPIIDPIRRLIPPLAGMIDISPIIAILALQFGYGIVDNILRSV